MDAIHIAYRRKDDPVDGVLLVKTAQVRASSNGSRFLDMTVMDATGEMNAKGWNWGEAPAPEPGGAVRLKGMITEFAGKLQLRVDRLRPAKEEETVWEELVPCAPESGQALYDQIYAVASSFTDADLKLLTQYLMEERKEDLLIWPAAVSFHHAERSGLLHHTATMLKAAQALLPIYDFLNADLLLCGVIVHDLCKMVELGASPLGLASEYTPAGVLLGHIVTGVAHIGEVGHALGLSEENILLVQHMVLSHHETPEFGSPRPPMFPEAELLHHLDVIDARMFDMQHALRATPEGGFSDRVRSLENRRLYRHK